MARKVTSVLELSRYKVGDTAYWLTLRHLVTVPELDEEGDWITCVHPKELYQGPYRKLWPYHARLPRLHEVDFHAFIALLTSELCPEEFVIYNINRSADTGEFYYANEDDEWMPEACLFDTAAAARRERSRILNLIRKWAKDS